MARHAALPVTTHAQDEPLPMFPPEKRIPVIWDTVWNKKTMSLSYRFIPCRPLDVNEQALFAEYVRIVGSELERSFFR